MGESPDIDVPSLSGLTTREINDLGGIQTLKELQNVESYIKETYPDNVCYFNPTKYFQWLKKHNMVYKKKNTYCRGWNHSGLCRNLKFDPYKEKRRATLRPPCGTQLSRLTPTSGPGKRRVLSRA